MIVYDGIKTDFMNDVRDNLICNKIYEQYQKYFGRTNEAQMRAWQNSMQYMRNVLDSSDIPDNAGVAIEYNIPTTSKRIDFIITGAGGDSKKNVVIIELKQWSDCEAVEAENGVVVETYVGHGIHRTPHPSYQAWSYAVYIDNYVEVVQDDKIGLFPCAFLHNYHFKENDPILAEQYKDYIEAAPMFGAEDFPKLREFISKHIKKGDDGKTIYEIDHGRFRPSKSLQDCLSSMLAGNKEFVLIDDQKVAFETAMRMAKKAIAFNEKQVLIVEGGPGTGKTVLAINLLVELTKINATAFYVTRNGTPRAVFRKKLQGDFKKDFIESCFQNSGNFYDVAPNAIDALIVDEAHRLTEKSGFMNNLGENQIKEIINASKFSIFFIDEDQKVTLKDIGAIDSIQVFAEELGAKCEKIELESQFRCNGSDGYLAWLNNLLEIKKTANFNDMDFNYDFKVFDDPNEMRDAIIEKNKINNKSRIVAGYCWDWDKDGKNDVNFYDITIPKYQFGMSWNLGDTSQTWAIEEGSVNEAGCIHTCQGLELDYVGVIIGDDLVYRDGQIVTDITKRAKTDQSIKGYKRLLEESPEEGAKILDRIIKNTYKVLMTRGMKGCYVFCTDDELREYIKTHLSYT
ncbi:MAG: DUF2075 domain-containing protein [Candidatus Saccharibacteria bacterium]|nr:DUF2075 domain-containing protein [Candidatus Saccharibacteria bacterium]